MENRLYGGVRGVPATSLENPLENTAYVDKHRDGQRFTHGVTLHEDGDRLEIRGVAAAHPSGGCAVYSELLASRLSAWAVADGAALKYKKGSFEALLKNEWVMRHAG